MALCAFFVLGVATGVSGPGREAATRAIRALANLETAAVDSLKQVWFGSLPAGSPNPSSRGAIALVERHDGFYALFGHGDLHGPISPSTEGDLPIISGPAVENATPEILVKYAAILVRAEAGLSEMVSEMRVGLDGIVSLFLDRSRTELMLDLDGAPVELKRAGQVLRQWQGHENLIAALDMTTPDQAVVRLHNANPTPERANRAMRKVAISSSNEADKERQRRSPY